MKYQIIQNIYGKYLVADWMVHPRQYDTVDEARAAIEQYERNLASCAVPANQSSSQQEQK